MTGPLTGYRIIDLSSLVSGPVATMLLGDQGADVIKVEIPGVGDLSRRPGPRRANLSATFITSNRSKRSIALNLKDDKGLDILKRLVRTADVVVQNFRPGVAERLGAGEAALRQEKPDLIYVSISGFGERGPYANNRVYDPIIQALSGLAAVQGGSENDNPRMVRTILPDKLTALTAAQAITAALLARARSGEGQHIRLSMLDAVVSYLWPYEMAGYTFIGEAEGAARPEGGRDLIYETADGYITVAVISDQEWAGLSRALEMPEWLNDPRFATGAAREKNLAARLEVTAQRLKTRTTDAWLERLQVEQVPCAPVLRKSELFDHPQLRANEIIIEYEHPHAGATYQTRPAAQFDRTPANIQRPAPLLGEQTDEILSEIGVSSDEIKTLKAAKVIA